MSEEYLIVTLDQKSWENTLLFWKPEGKGYTSNLEEAGLFDKEVAQRINSRHNNVAIPLEDLLPIAKSRPYQVIDCSFSKLKEYKKDFTAKEGSR